ncbi:MFS transporter small subunit [Hymenobacter radiodurans]
MENRINPTIPEADNAPSSGLKTALAWLYVGVPLAWGCPKRLLKLWTCSNKSASRFSCEACIYFLPREAPNGVLLVF